VYNYLNSADFPVGSILLSNSMQFILLFTLSINISLYSKLELTSREQGHRGTTAKAIAHTETNFSFICFYLT